jgi:phosphoenolpyruvate carboxykinase (GTP)
VDTTSATTSSTGSRSGSASRTRRRSSTSIGSAGGSTGKLLWPGFGENIRVLSWILGRVEGTASARETPIGSVPSQSALDVGDLDLGADQLEQLLAVDREEWLAEDSFEYLSGLGTRLPKFLMTEHRALVERLKSGNS